MRNLPDDRGEPLALPRQGDDVTTAERGAPRDEPLRVCAWQCTGEAQGSSPVLKLHAHVEQLSGATFAFPEPAVVEDHDQVTGGNEAFGVGIEP